MAGSQSPREGSHGMLNCRTIQLRGLRYVQSARMGAIPDDLARKVSVSDCC
jgi:hypothetical protein